MNTEAPELPSQRTKVSSRNQITLPAAVLAGAEIRAGDVLRVEVVADGVIRLVRERSRLDAIIGIAPDLTAHTDLETLRDEWHR